MPCECVNDVSCLLLSISGAGRQPGDMRRRLALRTTASMTATLSHWNGGLCHLRHGMVWNRKLAFRYTKWGQFDEGNWGILFIVYHSTDCFADCVIELSVVCACRINNNWKNRNAIIWIFFFVSGSSEMHFPQLEVVRPTTPSRWKWAKMCNWIGLGLLHSNCSCILP